MQELVIPVVLEPLAESGLNHTEVNYTAQVVQLSRFCQGSRESFRVFHLYRYAFRLDLEVENIVMAVQVAALAFVAYYAVTCTNFVRTDYRIRHAILQ